MRKILFAGFSLIALAGCGSEPKTLAQNPQSVAIQFDGQDQLKHQVMDKAASRCSQWGKVPELTGVSEVDGAHIATFRCVTSS